MDVEASEIEKAAGVLAAQLAHSDLDTALRRHVPQPLLGESEDRIAGTKGEKARLLVEARGSELLHDKDLRQALVRGNPGVARELTSEPGGETVELEEVALKAWHAGKRSARTFCQAFGFPGIFAGRPSDGRQPDLEEVQPALEIPALKDFQQDVVDQILDILDGRDQSRGMLSLPTGAGKTRTAMTAITRYQDRHPDSLVVWLATTGEICEQAVQSFMQVRKSDPPLKPIQVQRFWGSHSLDPDLDRGIMVASVQKMHSQLQRDRLPRFLLDEVEAVFFDEGHHATARTYDLTIQYLRDESQAQRVPIVGLTATPGRGSDPESRASKKLVEQFEGKLITPRLSGWNDPVTELQDRGILSSVKPLEVRTNREYELSEKMAEHWEEFRDFGPRFLEKVGRDEERNAIILQHIDKFGAAKQGLIYACSVEHAKQLAFLLTKTGYESTVITGETRGSIRDQSIQRFQDGEIQFLTNFGVLTTGFDAPNVELIALARPIASQVLYEQMLGRGLRGPEFGGTEECTILDFEDSIDLHGKPLAYRRFVSLWE